MTAIHAGGSSVRCGSVDLLAAPDHAEAREFLTQNEATLFAMYESKLQPLTNVPRLAIKPEEVMWLNLDHRAGFLLSQIDGTVDYESLFALSGLPRLDTARILSALLLDGVIGAFATNGRELQALDLAAAWSRVTAPVLAVRMRRINKRFGPVQANADVDHQAHAERNPAPHLGILRSGHRPGDEERRHQAKQDVRRKVGGKVTQPGEKDG